MSSRSLLLVMLVLVCLQSCTEAQNGNGPSLCCFTYQSSPIPSKQVEVYKKTQAGCTKPGTIFFLKNKERVCADPAEEWVQTIMKKKEKIE